MPDGLVLSKGRRALDAWFLGQEPTRALRRSVLALALPAIGEQILTMMVGLVDTYMVGHLGASELAAVGLANQVVMLALTLVTALASGTTALVARQIGADDPNGAQRSTQQSVLLGLLIGVSITALVTLGAQTAVRFYGPAEDVLALGTQYLRIACLTFSFQAILLLGNAALRGAGDTRTPLYVMLFVNVVNIVVSYSLIYGSGPLPAMGVLGSAIGAAVARACGGMIMLVLLARGRLRLHFRRDGWRLEGATIRRILNIGLPAGGEQLLMRLGEVGFVRVVASLGTLAFAAHQVAITGQSLSFMPGFGFSVAATTLVGQSLGAHEPQRARAYVRESLRMAATLMGSMGLILVIFAPQVTSLFVSEPEVIALGARCNRILGAGEILIAAMMVYSGALRGAGDTRYSMVVTSASIWLVRLPLAFLFTSILGLGLPGVWYALLVDMSLRTLLYWRRFDSGAWARIRV